jgi:hypothetical protein
MILSRLNSLVIEELLVLLVLFVLFLPSRYRGSTRAFEGLAFGLAPADRPAGLAEAPVLKGGVQRSFLRSG